MSSRARERKWLFAIVIFPDKEIVRGIAQRPAHGVKARGFVLVDEPGALMPARAGLVGAVVIKDAEAAGVVGGEFPSCHAASRYAAIISAPTRGSIAFPNPLMVRNLSIPAGSPSSIRQTRGLGQSALPKGAA